MIEAPIPQDDDARLESLRGLDVLDTSDEERFDRITRVAQRIFGVPIALVSLVDRDRQWFKSRQGLAARETPRNVSFCGHAILNDDTLVVPDATRDERFADNPLVTGEPDIRFYAGCPLKAPDGQQVGTLCIIDQQPRELAEADLGALRDLAAMVEQELGVLALVTIDSLTGLTNRRGFERVARQAIGLSSRHGRPVTLLFIDLDGFKAINDELGHAAGDRALIEMSRLLLEAFRESDVVARLGGDEFCVLMSDTPASEVELPLKRLGELVKARNEAPGARFALRYSTGVVSNDQLGPDSLASLLAEADRRMYEQKRKQGADGVRGIAQVLLDLAGALSFASDYDERMQRLCSETARLLGCDRSSIFLRRDSRYGAAFNHGNPPDLARLFPKHSVAVDDPLISAARKKKGCVVVNDAASSPLVNAELARAARIRSIVVAPLLGKDGADLGFITAEYNDRAGTFRELDATLLQGVARLAAAATALEARDGD